MKVAAAAANNCTNAVVRLFLTYFSMDPTFLNNVERVTALLLLSSMENAQLPHNLVLYAFWGPIQSQLTSMARLLLQLVRTAV